MLGVGVESVKPDFLQSDYVDDNVQVLVDLKPVFPQDEIRISDLGLINS